MIAIAFPLFLLLAPGSRAPPRVHLEGTARIDVQAARSSGRVVLSGTVTDDATKSIESVPIFVRVSRGDHETGANVILAAAAPESCGAAGSHPALDSAERLSLRTDDSGRFCLSLVLPSDRYVAHVEVPASPHIGAARADLPFNSALRSATLRFDPAPSSLSLDDAMSVFDVVASVPGSSDGLTLQLRNEAGVLLADATTDATGRARFQVPSAHLGPPGAGELRVVFSGSAEVDECSHSQGVERRTRVHLIAPAATGARLPAAWPEDGMDLRVVAQAACIVRGCAASPTGTIEVHVGSILVGASTLDRGGARLIMTFATGSEDEIPLRLSYTPDAPGFQSEEEVWLAQPIHRGVPWGRASTMVAGIGVVAWFFLTRLRLRHRSEARTSATRPTSVAAGGVAHVRHVEGGRHDGWSGKIADAHDDAFVVGAEVRIERPGFDRAEVIARAESGPDGAFALPPVATQPGDQLVVESATYSPLRRSLPSQGHLHIAVVLRKRALLDRLVAWAHQHRGRFDSRREPTPADVGRAAGSNSPIAHWADALETAIYGGSVVDGTAEAEIDRLAPDTQNHEAGGGHRGPPRG